MTLELETPPLPLRMDDSGTVRVGDSRVTLDTVIALFNQGDSPEEISYNFPMLKLADVYAVISFYLNRKADVDRYLGQRECEAEQFRQTIESQPGYPEWRQRMRAHLEARRAKGQPAGGR